MIKLKKINYRDKFRFINVDHFQIGHCISTVFNKFLLIIKKKRFERFLTQSLHSI